MKIVTSAVCLGGLLLLGGCSPQQAGLDFAKAIGIGVTAEWYTSTVNRDPAVGVGGVDRAAAYEQCEGLGLQMVNASAHYNAATMGMGGMLGGGGLSRMNRQAKAARYMTDQCMLQQGFQRTRNW